MSAQYDFVPGNDFSWKTSATALEIWQAIAQLTTANNIAGIVVSSSAPDVANNDRFKNYIWLDNTNPNAKVPKTYNEGASTWGGITVGDATITNAKLVDATIQIGKLAATGGTAGQQIRVNAGATGLEFFTETTGASSVDPLTDIDTSAAAVGQVLMFGNNGTGGSDGLLKWRTMDPAAFIAAGSFPLSKLAAGTNGYIMQMVSGSPSWVANSGAALSDGTISIAKFIQNEAPNTATYVLRKTNVGSALEYGPNEYRYFGPVGGQVPPDHGAAIAAITHGLGGIPDTIQWFAEVINAIGGYSVGDRIPLTVFVNGSNRSIYTSWASSTQLGLVADSTAGGGAGSTIHFNNKTTGADTTTDVDSMDTYFKFYCTAVRYNR